MVKTRYLFLCLLFSLMLSFPTLAVWEPAENKVEYLTLNNNAYAFGYNIKIGAINVESKTVNVQIKDPSNKLVYDGVLTAENGYEKEKTIKIYASDFRYYDPARPLVKLDVRAWTDVEIISANFPPEIYRLDSYRVFTHIKNPTKSIIKYSVELNTEGNTHVAFASQDSPLSFKVTTNKLSKKYVKEVTLEPGEAQKVYFEMQPYKAKEGEIITPEFIIRGESGQIIKTVNLGPLDVTSNLVGYIEDIRGPTLMVTGEELTLKIRVRNSWIGASNDFFLKLVAPEFIIKDRIRQFKAFGGTTQEIKYKIAPVGGGAFLLRAELYNGQKLLDTYYFDVNVLGEKIYHIKSASHNGLEGNEGTISVDVTNDASITNTMTVKASSEDFKIENPKALIKLAGKSKTTVIFNAVRINDKEKSNIKIDLLDTEEKYADREYGRENILIDSKSIVVRKSPVVIPMVKPQKNASRVETKDIITVEDETESDVLNVPATPGDNPEVIVISDDTISSNSNINQNWPYAVIALLLLVITLLLIMAAKKRKSLKPMVKAVRKEKK